MILTSENVCYTRKITGLLYSNLTHQQDKENNIPETDNDAGEKIDMTLDVVRADEELDYDEDELEDGIIKSDDEDDGEIKVSSHLIIRLDPGSMRNSDDVAERPFFAVYILCLYLFLYSGR